MSVHPTSLPPAGWYPDPWNQAAVRWFDGAAWTAQLSNQPGWYPDPQQQSPLRWFDGRMWTAHVHDPHVRPVASDTGPVASAQADSAERLWQAAVDSAKSTGVLAHLIGEAAGIAVIDVETTGLGRHDRITELGIVTLDAKGQTVSEFDTLINPRRDIGPTWVHGITASMVADAPEFAEVADLVAEQLHGMIVLAHNVRFDSRMVAAEMAACGIATDWGTPLDTLSVTSAKLAVACADHGIEIDRQHCAIHDARATAQLAMRTASRFDAPGSPASFSGYSSGGTVRLASRSAGTVVTERQERPYIAVLAEGARVQQDVSAYALMLDQALDDLKLTADEKESLRTLAEDLGLSSSQVSRAHRAFLDQIIEAALDDGVVTDDELEQLLRVAQLLDIDPHVVSERTNSYRSQLVEVKIGPGMRVCFTGDGGLDSCGVVVPRENLEAAAMARDLEVVESVTSKGCDLLVAADVATMSGKAKSAHKFSIPIVSVADFLTGVDDRVPVQGLTISSLGVASVCQVCGASWVAARRASKCADCRRGRR